MATKSKIKRVYKSLNFISKIFVVKEKQIEIGHPTDVKHVAHIGLDAHLGTAPSWMNEFKTAPDFTATSIDFGHPTGCQPAREMIRNLSSKDLQNVPKKQIWEKKSSTTSSPKSSSSKCSRKSKSKAAYAHLGSSTDFDTCKPSIKICGF